MHPLQGGSLGRVKKESRAKSAPRSLKTFYTGNEDEIINAYKKNPTAYTFEELEATLLPNLQANYQLTFYTGSIYSLNKTERYIVLKCKVCKKFQHWFNLPNGVAPITYNRLINR